MMEHTTMSLSLLDAILPSCSSEFLLSFSYSSEKFATLRVLSMSFRTSVWTHLREFQSLPKLQ
jgi:hypothetical protein